MILLNVILFLIILNNKIRIYYPYLFLLFINNNIKKFYYNSQIGYNYFM